MSGDYARFVAAVTRDKAVWDLVHQNEILRDEKRSLLSELLSAAKDMVFIVCPEKEKIVARGQIPPGGWGPAGGWRMGGDYSGRWAEGVGDGDVWPKCVMKTVFWQVVGDGQAQGAHFPEILDGQAVEGGQEQHDDRLPEILEDSQLWVAGQLVGRLAAGVEGADPGEPEPLTWPHVNAFRAYGTEGAVLYQQSHGSFTPREEEEACVYFRFVAVPREGQPRRFLGTKLIIAAVQEAEDAEPVFRFIGRA